MLNVYCFVQRLGWRTVLVPVKYRALVARYAQFEDFWYSPETDASLWLQLPGVVVERAL